MSLQLASECLRNSRDVVDELPKVELSSDMEKITSALKSILEMEERRRRPSKRLETCENGALTQPSMKVWIICERQFSCLRDLIKQSMEMINIHLKQCQFNSLNNLILSGDQTHTYLKEEISSGKVKLEERDGQEEVATQEVQDLELRNVINSEQENVELHNDINPVDFELYQSKFDEENSTIDNNCVTESDIFNNYSNSLYPVKRRRKKRKIHVTEDIPLERKKRKKLVKMGSKKLNDDGNIWSSDNSTPLAGNYYQNNQKDIDFPIEEGDANQARERLKELIRLICLWPYGTEIPVDYDILQGQSPSHYGLNARGGGKPYIFELVMLSLESPIFLQRRTCVQFYSKLFRVPLRPWKIKIRNMYLFWERGGDLKTCDKYRFPCSSKVLKELILKGFHSFNPFTNADLRIYDDEEGVKSITDCKQPKEVKNFEDLFMCTPSSRLNCPAPNFFVAPKNRRHAHDGIETLAQTNNPALDWLTANQLKELKVMCQNRCYGQGAFFQQHVGLIPDFSLNHVFAIVAMIVDDDILEDTGQNDKEREENKEDEMKEHCYHAKILARSASCSNANPSEDFENLYKVVIESLGLSYHDVFRNSYALPTTQSAKNLHDHYFKVPTKPVYAHLESLGEEGVRKQMEVYNSEIEQLSIRNQHVPLKDLPQNKCIKLIFDGGEDGGFNFSKVNNISVLMGLDPENIQVRSLLSEEAYLASFSMKKSTATSADANEILPWVLLDLFCTFHGFTTHEIFDPVPEYEKKFTHLRDTYNKMRACKEILNRQNVICQVRIIQSHF